MKKQFSLMLLILVALLYPKLNAQVDLNIDQNLTDIFFADSMNGWIVGDSGFIALTTDGGNTWIKSISGVTESLTNLFFIDSANGWIGGEYGVILMTADGGSSWQTSPSNTNESILDIEFANSTIGWFSDGKDAHKTDDGGVSWNQQTDSLNIKFLSVLDTNQVWFLENVWSVYMSVDGGDSLIHVESGFAYIAICGSWEENFDMGSAVTGLIVGTFWCYKMHGVGIDYSALMIGLESIDSLIWMPVEGEGAGGSPLDAVQFVTDEIVWAIGEDGAIIKSNDGGTNWIQQESGILYDLLAVSFIDTLTGWVLSEHNLVLNTTDGGKNWHVIIAPQNSPPKITLPENISLEYLMPDTLIMSDFVFDFDDSDSLHTWERIGCLDGEGSAECLDINILFRNDTLILEYIGIGIGFSDLTFIVSDSGGLRDMAVVNFNLLGPEGTSDISGIPTNYLLSQSYPNPFNPSTTIAFTLPHSGDVSLTVYNLIGEEIIKLISGNKQAGYHTVKWNASNVPSGIYFYRLQAGGFVKTKKMILFK